MPRFSRLRIHSAALCALLLLGSSACSKRPTTTLPPTTGNTLCDAETEEEYMRTLGYGAIRVVEDSNIPGPAIAFVQNGQAFIVLNPNDFGSRPIEFQDMILAHEIGHHYLGGPPNRNSEYRADAFAVRALVTQDALSVQRVEAALTAILANPRPGDAEHPPDVDRVAYMRLVYQALLNGDECAPTAPDE